MSRKLPVGCDAVQHATAVKIKRFMFVCLFSSESAEACHLKMVTVSILNSKLSNVKLLKLTRELCFINSDVLTSKLSYY